MHRAVLAGLVSACAASGSPQLSPPVPADPEIVQLETGSIRGERSGESVAWRGIPYAAPPVGPLRWKPPAPALAWQGVRDATGFGYVCMQAGTSSDPDGTVMGSEDCLTVNVWRPAAVVAPRAVMVFVHGGYFTWGAASYRNGGVDLYDGARFAVAADVVVVTLNYRLGPFGFLAHPALAAEDPHRASGDYGLLDQIAALRWVQRNIRAFGGDPDRVTLFGQSAGAISSAALYASPLARGLFQRAILHSGTGDAIPREKAERGGVELTSTVGCNGTADPIGCLRGKSATAITSALPLSFAPGGNKFGPVVDGWVLPRKPIEIVEAGAHARVPLIVATTSNEFSTMIQNYLDGPIATADDYATLVGKRFPYLAKRLLAQYPASAFANPLAAYTAMLSDASFACPSDWLASAAAAHGPAYRFVYAHSYGGRLARFGAGHGMDLYLVFRNTPRWLALDATERALSDQLIATWAQFAKTGDPGWPRHTADRREQTVLDQTIHAGSADAGRCDFWRPILRPRQPIPAPAAAMIEPADASRFD